MGGSGEVKWVVSRIQGLSHVHDARLGGRQGRKKIKVTGRIKGDQVVGIVDPGAAARPIEKGGKVTKHPREKGDKRVPLARDLPRKSQRRSVRDLTMSSMAL